MTQEDLEECFKKIEINVNKLDKKFHDAYYSAGNDVVFNDLLFKYMKSDKNDILIHIFATMDKIVYVMSDIDKKTDLRVESSIENTDKIKNKLLDLITKFYIKDKKRLINEI
jgi:hypothetical protein